MRVTAIGIEPLPSKVPDLYLVTLDVSYRRAKLVAGMGHRVCLLGHDGRSIRGGLALRQPEEPSWLLVRALDAVDVPAGSIWELVGDEAAG